VVTLQTLLEPGSTVLNAFGEPAGENPWFVRTETDGPVFAVISPDGTAINMETWQQEAVPWTAELVSISWNAVGTDHNTELFKAWLKSQDI
jgi:hypothetical protein